MSCFADLTRLNLIISRMSVAIIKCTLLKYTLGFMTFHLDIDKEHAHRPH